MAQEAHKTPPPFTENRVDKWHRYLKCLNFRPFLTCDDSAMFQRNMKYRDAISGIYLMLWAQDIVA
jgi:hypothetical protein